MPAAQWLAAAAEPVAAAAGQIADAATQVAAAAREGELVVVAGTGDRAAHASHLAVEFLHPVVAGRRAVAVVVGGHDTIGAAVVVDLDAEPHGPAFTTALGAIVADDDAPGRDVALELTHHTLWEATHVALDRLHAEGRADDPFADPDAHRADPGAGLAELVAERVARSTDVTSAAVEDAAPVLEAAADDVARRRRLGGRVWTLGNGGSAADAAVAARLLGGIALTDAAVTTALANDIGVDDVFTRQVRALVGQDDVVLGLSTSGTSRNVISALAAARDLGALTIAAVGSHRAPIAEHVVSVESDSIHRIQEAHLALVTELGRRASS